MFAIIQNFSSNGKIYWVHSPLSPRAAIFGSYVNHNHYAGLVEMLVFLVILIVGYIWIWKKGALEWV